MNDFCKPRWCTRECALTSSARTLRRTCWVGSEPSVSLLQWSPTAPLTGKSPFTLHEIYTLNIKHFFMIEPIFCCVSDPFRRCSSYQDFTQIGDSTESVDFPRTPSDGEDPSQRHRNVSRTLSEPSHLAGGRMGTSRSEPRGRRSVRQRNSRLSQGTHLNPSGLL